MFTNATATTDTAPTRRIDLDVSPWQFEALFRCDRYRLLNLIGGRGSGKSYIEKLRVMRWAKLSTELHWGIFGASDTVLQTILAPIVELVDAMEIEHRYEREAPPEWRMRWRRDGIKFPPRRLRSHKIWIWDNGMHIVTGSLMNNAYTRFKSIEYNGIYIGESTEPGVTKNAILTLLGAIRCGKATRGADRVWRCNEPGHLHQLVMAGNVPLNDPGHFMYKLDSQLAAKEEKRAEQEKPPFYRLITSATQDNKFTGSEYVETLEAAMDEKTFIQQTTGRLERNAAATSYHAFSERNILDTLTYDPTRPLHVWFDFNVTPATAGWGHDLRYDEVPSVEWRRGLDYFGIHGELFSGPEPMQTDQVAYALLEDPSVNLTRAESRCADCNCWMRDHLELDASAWLCRRCNADCRGVAAAIDERAIPTARSLIHAPANWRGLARHRAAVYVYGDATGKATHADATQPGGSRNILRRIFAEALGDRLHMRFKNANPPIKNRVLAVNRGFKAANGIRRHFVARWCVAHVADFREVIPNPKTGEPLKVAKDSKRHSADDEYWLRTDISDGWGYHVDFRWPALIPSASAYVGDPLAGEATPMDNEWPEP